MLIVGADGRYLDANAAAGELFGCGPPGLLRMRAGDLPVAGPEWTAEERRHFVQHGSWSGRMTVRRQDGSVIPLEVRASAVVLPTTTAYLPVLRDESERRAIERLQRGLAALLSHKLQGTRGALQALARHVRGRHG